MMTFRLSALSLVSAALLCGQLSPQQKMIDFQYLIGLYDKQYAPYEWKRQLFGFDALSSSPWLDRITASKDDLEFYEILVDYVARLNDTHDSFSLSSDFVAQLGLTVDIYDGKVLIDSINRFRLPVADFPFVVGDELVSVDGKSVEQWITELSKYAIQANPRSTRRRAAGRIVTRPQSRMPRAAELGDNALVVIRRAEGLATYTLPWIKTGTPIRVGRVPSPELMSADAGAALPDYFDAWREVQYSAESEPFGELGNGARAPIYAMPSDFVARLPRVASDFFFSGTFRAGGYRIGYIRIPSYNTLAGSVLRQFEAEIAFFQQNTDGLIVDQMRNPGGFVCFGDCRGWSDPYEFAPIGYELRATSRLVNGFANALANAKAQGAEQWVIDQLTSLLEQLRTAYRENRGRTGSIPLCTSNYIRQPAPGAYNKPILMIIDEFSTSTADSVPAMLQDARRATLFGMRTNGAGGTNTAFAGGAYGEGTAGVTLGLMTRSQAVSISGYPTTSYIENVGVHPDIELDYMTKDNLLQRGKPFVDAFTAAMVDLIQRQQ